MDNYVAIVFDSDEKAFEGLHTLWDLDASGDITVHGAAVIHRDKFGRIDVATKDTDPGVRTIVGVGIGALLGALAGPIGAAAGIAGAASIAAGTAANETGLAMNPGQAAVIAEVSEDWTTPIDTAMKPLGGVMYRRAKTDVRDSWFQGDYLEYLYPYDYRPRFES
jgi:uncharacterized membrane protein